MHMPNGCFVLVADGRKRLLFRNAGDSLCPRLEVLEVDRDDNPADHVRKTDGAGRAFASSQAGAGRSAYDEPDYHVLAEADFAAGTARILGERALAHALGPLIVVADPRTLGALRDHYHPAMRGKLIGELAADLVGHPVVEIEHSPGVVSRYGHLEPDLRVRLGQSVSAGDTVGSIGLTGNTTGAHLHLEIYSSGEPVDPHLVLPPRP